MSIFSYLEESTIDIDVLPASFLPLMPIVQHIERLFTALTIDKPQYFFANCIYLFGIERTHSVF